MNKFKIILILMMVSVLSFCVFNEAEDKDLTEEEIAALIAASNDSTTSTTCTNPSTTAGEVEINGTVYEDASVGDSQVVSGVQINTDPSVSTVTVTDSTGSFKIDTGLCDGVNYTVVAEKLGYNDKELTVTTVKNDAQTISFNLERDTSAYTFPTIKVYQPDGTNSVSGATIEYVANGSTVNTITSSSGTASTPFPKSTSSGIQTTIAADSYTECSFVYTYSSSGGTVSGATGCTVSMVSGIIQATLQ